MAAQVGLLRSTREQLLLRDECSTLEKALLAQRLGHYGVQRKVLQLTSLATEWQQKEWQLSFQLQTQQREQESLADLRQTALRLRQDVLNQLQERKLARSMAADAAAMEEKHLQQLLAQDMDQKTLVIREQCAQAQKELAIRAENTIEEIRWKQVKENMSLERLEEEQVARAGAAAAQERVKQEGALEQLRSQLSMSEDALERARFDMVYAQKEHDWLADQLSALRAAEGKLRLEELQFQDAKQCAEATFKQRQQYLQQILPRKVEEAKALWRKQRGRLKQELLFAQLAAAQELQTSAAQCCAALDTFEAPDNQETLCGIGGVSGRPEGADVDRLLFSGDEGVLSLPPTPPELSPSNTAESPGGALETHVKAPCRASGSASSRLMSTLSELQRASLGAVRRAHELLAVPVAPPRVPEDGSGLQRFQLEAALLRNECHKLMDLNSSLRCKLDPGGDALQSGASVPGLNDEDAKLQELQMAFERLTTQNQKLRQELHVPRTVAAPRVEKVVLSFDSWPFSGRFPASSGVSELKEQAQSLASIRRARSTSTPRARANARRKVKPAQASPGSPGASSRQAQSLSWCVDEPPMSPAQSPELGVSTLQALPGRDDGDFQWANAERRRLETECRVHQLSSEELRQEVQKLNESCQLLQRELELEVKKGQLAEDRHGAEKEALEASLRNTHAQGQKDQHQALHAVKSSNVEKDRALQALSSMLIEMQIVVADLQKALAEQLSGFRSLTLAVRSLLKDLRPLDALQSQEKKLQELQLQLREAAKAFQKERAESSRMAGARNAELEGMKDMVKRWKKETEARKQHAEELSQSLLQASRKAEQQKRREQREKTRDQIQMVKDVARVWRGVGASVVEPDGRLQKCRLRIEFDTWPGLLVWLDDQRSEWIGSCQLSAINLLAYGFASKAWNFCDAPENSFSVHTTSNIFSFVSAGDAEFYSILPVLSRLCAHVQGWPVMGSISSRAQLVRWHGWCKVQQSLRKRKAGNLLTFILEKLHRPKRQEKAATMADVEGPKQINAQAMRPSDLKRLTAWSRTSATRTRTSKLTNQSNQ